MKKKLFIFTIIQLALIFTFTVNSIAKPVLVISHPDKGLFNNVLYMQEKNILVKTDFIFLFHERETEIETDLKKILRKKRIRNYEIIKLKGLPEAPGFKELVAKNPKRFPAPDVERFNVKRDGEIPSSWLKVFQKVLNNSDGYLIPGGYDIPATIYNEKQFIETWPGGALRSSYETAFIRYLLAEDYNNIANKPEYFVLGICLGCQMLNTATGGHMTQSIPLEIYGKYYVEDLLKLDHDNLHKNYYLNIYPAVEKIYGAWFHRIKMTSVSSKYCLPLKDVFVLSNHHQTVTIPGYNFKTAGTSMDMKVNELFTHKKYPNVIAVQFHPEKKFCWDRIDNYNKETRLFHEHFWSTVSKTLKLNNSLRKLVRNK